MPRRRFSITLSDFVSSARDNIIETTQSIRTKLISDFNDRVVSEGLSLDTQLQFWQEMKKRENETKFPSSEFVQTTNEQISSLQKQVRAKTYRDGLQEMRNDIAKQKKTNEDLAEWLGQQLQAVVDPDLKEEMQREVETVNNAVEQDYRDSVDALVERSRSDHSQKIIDDAMKIADRRLSQAVSNGNNNAETFWRGQKTVIQQQSNTNKAEDAENEALLAVFKNEPALDVLQVWTDAINKLPNDGIPIFMTVNGVKLRFQSVRDFVQTKRTSFLNDPGSDGFFEMFRTQQSDLLDSQITRWGTLNDTVITNLQRSIDNLSRNSVLAPYVNQINNLKYDANGLLKKAVENNAARLTSKFLTDYNFDAAANEIQRLGTKYGVDVTAQLNALVVEFGNKKEDIYNQVVGAAAQLQSQNPGMSWADAVAQASKYMRGGLTSPLEFVRNPIMQLINQAEKAGVDALAAPGSSAGGGTGSSGLKNKNIAKANPEVVVNDAFIHGVYLEKFGRKATDAELARFRGQKVKDVANIVLREQSPWAPQNQSQQTSTTQTQQPTGSSTSTTPGTQGGTKNTQTPRQKYEAQGWHYLGTMDAVRAAQADPKKQVSLMEGSYYWKEKAGQTGGTTTPPATPPKPQSKRSQHEAEGWHYLGTMDAVRAAQADPKKTVSLLDGDYFWRYK